LPASAAYETRDKKGNWRVRPHPLAGAPLPAELPCAIHLRWCTGCTVRGFSIDGQNRLQRGVYFEQCVGCRCEDVFAKDFRTRPGDGNEAHSFQAYQGRENVFIECQSRSGKPRMMEDHGNLCEEIGSQFVDCRAYGFVRRRGTAFCVDEGCERCQLLRCQSKTSGPGEARSVTIYRASDTRMKDCYIDGIIGVDEGSVGAELVGTRYRQLWVAPGVTVAEDGESGVIA
jgi:hypothetical protein